MKKTSLVKLTFATAAAPAATAAAPANSSPSGWMFSQDDNDTVEVSRRRQGASSGPGPSSRPRADAPARRRDEGSGSSGGSGGGGSSSGGYRPSSGGGAQRMPLWLVALVVVGIIIYSLVSGGDNTSQNSQTNAPAEANQPQVNQPALVDEPTRVVVPSKTPAARKTSPAPSTGGTNQARAWTVMLYEDADDQILEEDMYLDLNEMEKVGSTDQVNIVAQMDRFKGAFKGDGNWTSARRYYIQQDDDLKKVNSQMVADLGEINMSDGATLVDFVTWAMKTYPAQHYALVLSDHGMGWPGGWSDGDSSATNRSSIPIVSSLDDNLYLMELGSALQDIQAKTGVEKLDLIGMDACLMSHLEVYAALEPYAKYAVASQETEPALGWAYTGFLGGLVQNPSMSGGDLGKLIVQSYIKDDQRIVDDEARSDFLRQGSPFGGSFGDTSAAQLVKEMSSDVTLTAVDLEALPGLMDQVNSLSLALQDEDQSTISNARQYAQSFTNIFGKGQSPYLDLGSFVQMLKREGAVKKVSQVADQVLAAEKQVILAEKHGSVKKGATGISIYFPNSTLYRTPISGAQSYTAVASQFAKTSLWDDFLAYHYNNVAINPSSNKGIVPGPSTKTRAPGAGTITVSPITLSSQAASPGKPVTMSAQIKGKNIGYVYLFVGYYDKQANSIFVIDTDYLQSPDTREVNGVYYPVWKENQSFTMKLKWDPTVFSVTDGSESASVALTPLTYGASPEEAVYTLDGKYTYTQDGQTRLARLYFVNGQLKHVFGFEGDAAAGAPSEIIPQAGDTFTVQETWMDLDSSGKVTGTSTQDGKVLTFGSQMFKWEEVYAAAGDYVVGFIVQDLDGNAYQSYSQIQVK